MGTRRVDARAARVGDGVLVVGSSDFGQANDLTAEVFDDRRWRPAPPVPDPSGVQSIFGAAMLSLPRCDALLIMGSDDVGALAGSDQTWIFDGDRDCRH